MSSNTKLDAYSKAVLKQFKRENPNATFAASPDGRVTVLVLPHPTLSMGQFSVAIASENEKKIRRKVGEFEALRRYLDGMSQPVNTANCEVVTIAGFLAAQIEEFN